MARTDVSHSGETPECRRLDTSHAGLSFVGCVARMHTDGTLRAAQADSAANCRSTMFVFQGRTGRAQLLGAGPVRVFLKAGLDSGVAPAINQVVYLSAATAGQCTNVAPAIGAGLTRPIGIIQNLGADGYDNTNGSLATVVSHPDAGAAFAVTTGADWDTVPSTVLQALDELASRVTDLEDAP